MKVGSWEHLEQIPTVMVTFVQATFVQLLLTRFGLNFKGKVKAKSMQARGKVRERSRQGQGKVKAWSS